MRSPRTMLCFVHSEPGYQHQNEDAVLIVRHPGNDEAFICSLADGQGGQSGGAEAAQIAVERSVQAATSHPIKRLLDPRSWYGILAAADEAVQKHENAGFTTLVSLCITEHKVCGASCGDSAALLISPGQELLLTENQRKNPPIGSGVGLPVAFSAKLKPPWRVLIVSDGVWKFVGWETVTQLAAQSEGEALITALRQSAVDANGGKLQDDFSIILLENQEA